MNTHLEIDTSTLTLPEQLMGFLHARNGRPYEAVQPAKVAAAAELAELVLAGHARVENGLVVVPHPVEGRREWITTVTGELAGRPTAIQEWIRRRRDALSRQQQLGVQHGVLELGRGRLLGVIGYDEHTVVPQVRRELLATLLAHGAEEDPQTAALASLLVQTRLHLRGGLSSTDRARLEQVAEHAVDLPAPRLVVTAVHAVVGYTVYSAITGD